MGMIRRFFVNLFVTPEIGSLVRHSINSLATVLVGVGALDPALADQFVDVNAPVIVGVSVWVINLFMSFKQKGEQKNTVNELQTEIHKLNERLMLHINN